MDRKTTRTKGDQAYDSLCELLRSNVLSAGDFVSITTLAEHTGCTIAATREAVQRAAAFGLITTLPKRGMLVLEATLDKIAQCLEVRRIFDEDGIRRLSRQKDPHHLESLIEQHLRIQHEARQGNITHRLQRDAMDLDWTFHTSMAANPDNPEVDAIYALNRDKLAIMYNTRPILPDRIEPAFDEHIRIMQAVLEGDADRAAEELDHHYRQIRRWWGIL